MCEIKIKNAETRQFKAIFPNTLNANDSLFGGTAMQWMDEVAYITATRFTKMKMVTLSVEKTQFLAAIKAGTIVEIIGKIVNVGKLKIEVLVEIFVEEMYTENRKKAVESLFTLVSVNENHKPVRMK